MYVKIMNIAHKISDELDLRDECRQKIRQARGQYREVLIDLID